MCFLFFFYYGCITNIAGILGYNFRLEYHKTRVYNTLAKIVHLLVKTFFNVISALLCCLLYQLLKFYSYISFIYTTLWTLQATSL